MRRNKLYSILGFAAAGSMVLAACQSGGAARPVVQTVVVEVTKEVQTTVQTTIEKTVEVTAAPAAQWTTPHPILSNLKVRQAIATCADRKELIAVSYPFLSAEDQDKLLMDTWIPKSSPFYTKPSIEYTHDITKAGQMLDEAGWKLPEGENIRQNAAGDPLVLRFTTTNASFRQTWGAVFTAQMAKCGIGLQPSYIAGSIWFGANSGIARRDYELGAFAWVGQADPGGNTLYSCDNIPTPANNWKGQNAMGWCNKAASDAVNKAVNTLNVEERKKEYAIVQDEFAKDVPSLPMFQRSEAGAYTTALKNVKFNPTEYYSANADQWEGKDTVVLAFTQEPASMFSLVESSAVQRTAAQLVGGVSSTQYDFAYQPVGYADDKFPTIEDGGSTNLDVEIKDGDKFVGADGSVYILKDGKVTDLEGKDAADVKVKNTAGEEQDAKAGAKAPQIVTTFKFKADKWSDGEPVVKADRELAYKVDCDKTSGAVSYDTCDRISKVDFPDDNTIVVTYAPGYQYAFYYLTPVGTYPSHQVIKSDGAYKGKTLADVAPKDFATLPEIAELPIGSGPYILQSWDKGQRMTLAANPNYIKGEPKVKKIIIQFFGDTNGAVAALLNGEVDVVGTETLGAGAEVKAVLDAVAAKKPIEVFNQATPTWEHVDFNLNVK